MGQKCKEIFIKDALRFYIKIVTNVPLNFFPVIYHSVVIGRQPVCHEGSNFLYDHEHNAKGVSPYEIDTSSTKTRTVYMTKIDVYGSIIYRGNEARGDLREDLPKALTDG